MIIYLIFLFNSTVPSTALQTSSSAGSQYVFNWWSLRDQLGISFKVQSCSDARILLSSYLKNSKRSFYEIVLGAQSNSISTIAKDGSIVIQTSTPGLLNCRSSLAFWVGWRGGFIQVGTGSIVGDNGFLQFTDPLIYRIRAVSFDSINPVTALWELGRTDGRKCMRDSSILVHSRYDIHICTCWCSITQFIIKKEMER